MTISNRTCSFLKASTYVLVSQSLLRDTLHVDQQGKVMYGQFIEKAKQIFAHSLNAINLDDLDTFHIPSETVAPSAVNRVSREK